MPAAASARRHRARAPQLERELPLAPLAAARQVVGEVSLWLGRPLHGRYAARLAFQAGRCYALSSSFRAKLRRPGDGGRDMLYVFLRHWLAARLHAEHPDLFARLPPDFARGAPPCPRFRALRNRSRPDRSGRRPATASAPLGNKAGLLRLLSFLWPGLLSASA